MQSYSEVFADGVKVKFLLKVTLLQSNKGCEKIESDQQITKALIVQQILLIISIGNVWRTVWRIYTLIVGFKVLSITRKTNRWVSSVKFAGFIFLSTTGWTN